LQLAGVVLVGDAGIELLLLELQVALGQLIDRLVEEGRRTHGRLADRDVEDLVGVLVLEQLLEGVSDQGAGERLGGIVGGRALAVAPGEAVDEGALGNMRSRLRPCSSVSKTRSASVYWSRSAAGTK